MYRARELFFGASAGLPPIICVDKKLSIFLPCEVSDMPSPKLGLAVFICHAEAEVRPWFYPQLPFTGHNYSALFALSSRRTTFATAGGTARSSSSHDMTVRWV